MEDIKKVAIYTRVSTIEQAEGGYSLDEQQSKLKAYCDLRDWHVYKVYTDGGYSGSNLVRPAMSALLEDANARKFDTVLVYKLDRLSRSQKDTLYLIEDVFNPLKIDFVSLSENFDTSTPYGKAGLSMVAVFAQLEREQIKERMQLGKLGRAKSGKPMNWAIKAFGYEYKEGSLEIIPFEADIIRGMYEDYNAGISLHGLVIKLNEEGHLGKSKPWSFNPVRRILTNPLYAGMVPYKGDTFPGNHEPIISQALFDSVQAQIAIRQRTNAERFNPRPFQAKYMVSGIARCGICGAPMRLESQNKKKDGTRTQNYLCSCARREKSKHIPMKDYGPCDNIRFKRQDLENFVLGEVQKLKTRPGLLKKLATKKDKRTNFDNLQAQLDKVQSQLDKLIDLYLMDELSRDKLDARRDALLKEKSALLSKLEKQDAVTVDITPVSAILDGFKDIRSLPYQRACIVVKSLIERVEVSPNLIKITWRFEV